ISKRDWSSDVCSSDLNEEYHEDPFTLARGSEQALRDFAPGATFYSRGYAIEVDAVDLGRSQGHVRTWRCCPACGYVHEEGPVPRSEERRAGNGGRELR